MTTPALSVGLRSRGRHYPYPPADPAQWPKNRWGSLDPESLPDGHQFFPSVTNILSVIDKPALKYWAAEMALREMYDTGTLPLDVDAAIAAHKMACNRKASERADAGTRAHTLAERLTSDLPLPKSISDEDEAYADAFMAFWSDHSPEPIEVEATMYGDGYAGTPDLVGTVQVGFSREIAVVDYKTRGVRDEKKIARYGLLYDENRMQLAALAHCNYVAKPSGDGWDLLAAPLMTAAMGVVLFPDGSYATEPIDDLGRWYAAFQGALKLWEGLNV